MAATDHGKDFAGVPRQAISHSKYREGSRRICNRQRRMPSNVPDPQGFDDKRASSLLRYCGISSHAVDRIERDICNLLDELSSGPQNADDFRLPDRGPNGCDNNFQ